MPPEGKSGQPATPGVQPGGSREVIFEYTPLGASVKVTAIDCATGVEAFVLGPIGAPQRDLERLALHRLQQKITRETERALGAQKKPAPETGGRGGGIIV